MSFKLEIDTSNAAFGEDEFDRDNEIARILHQLADKLERDPFPGEVALRDVNGNRVGTAWITG